MYATLIIVDDFYPDPHKIREVALGFDYPEQDGNYPGRNSRQRLHIDGLDEAVSDILGQPVTGDMTQAHAQFRIALAEDQARYHVHVDTGVHWSGVAYLSLPEHCQGGTDLFRHIGTGTDRAPMNDDELAVFGAETPQEAINRVMTADANDLSRWEKVMTLPMRFNRLVLFRPWLWHAASSGFGTTLEDGRLIQGLFFGPDGEASNAGA
jgi:hypothetical protein